MLWGCGQWRRWLGMRGFSCPRLLRALPGLHQPRPTAWAAKPRASAERVAQGWQQQPHLCYHAWQHRGKPRGARAPCQTQWEGQGRAGDSHGCVLYTSAVLHHAPLPHAPCLHPCTSALCTLHPCTPDLHTSAPMHPAPLRPPPSTSVPMCPCSPAPLHPCTPSPCTSAALLPCALHPRTVPYRTLPCPSPAHGGVWPSAGAVVS